MTRKHKYTIIASIASTSVSDDNGNTITDLSLSSDSLNTSFFFVICRITFSVWAPQLSQKVEAIGISCPHLLQNEAFPTFLSLAFPHASSPQYRKKENSINAKKKPII